MRRYVVLAERTIQTDVSDLIFALLGFYDASTAQSARAQAARDHQIPNDHRLVAVPSKFWRSN